MTPRAIDRFQALLRIPTVSRVDETTTDWAQFDRFIATLGELYPLTHAALERDVIDGYSLLYRWRGKTAADPSVLMAHYDVVSATDAGWDHPPFAATATTHDGEEVIWGRGTLDDKAALVSVLEAVEAAIGAGFTPAHDIYLSFGHNEETTSAGAASTVAQLETRGVRPAFVLDEGGAIVHGIFPGVSDAIAVIGVSEKGMVSVSLTVEQNGGHASTPPRNSAPVVLARAILRLSRRPFPAKLNATTIEMIRTLGAHARRPYRWLFSTLWLTRPLLLVLFSRLSDETNAMLRTTQVVTELSGSQAANAMAETATATANVRIATGSSIAAAVRHMTRAIGDPRVRIDVLRPSEPSPVSPTTGAGWDLLLSTIDGAFPGTLATPYVMLGASDSRHFTRISEHVYRFSPFEMSTAERGTLHAVNERIRVSTFLRGIDFYERLIARL